MRNAGVLWLVLVAACGGLADDPAGDEASLGRKDGGCDAPAVTPVCTAPKKYAVLFRGQPKPKNFSNDASGEDENDMNNNILAMQAALAARGYDVASVDNWASFQSAIARLAKKVRCCDEVLVYYTGHGGHKRGNPRTDFGYLDAHGEMHYLAVDPVQPPAGGVLAAKQVDSKTLALTLSKLKTCHLHVVIDACYSGGFVDALLDTLPGLESIQTSASSTEPAYSGAIQSAEELGADGRPVNPPNTIQDPDARENGSEFSSGFIDGLNGAPRGDNAEQLVDAGFAHAMRHDVTALAKWTHPVNKKRNGGCTCLPNGDPWIPMCAPSPIPWVPLTPSQPPQPSETQPSPSPLG